MKIHNLYLVRGVSGSGKSTFCSDLVSPIPEDLVAVHSSDDEFMVDGEYIFNPKYLRRSHESCQNKVKYSLSKDIPYVFVNNTFVKEWEMKPYFDLAEQFDYKVITIVVENRHGSENIHNVPEKTIQRQVSNFSIKLR